MSARAPIQVPIELKEAVEALADKLHLKTNYDVIQHLVRYYESTEKWKRETAYQREVEKQAEEAAKAEEKRRIAAECIWVGTDVKTRYVEFSESLGLRSEQYGVDFLLGHYDASETFDKKTLQLLKNYR